MLPEEFDIWLGILLSCMLASFAIQDMWSTKDNSCFPPPAIGAQHNMTHNRLKAIKQCLVFYRPEPSPDLWKCQWLIDTFMSWRVFLVSVKVTESPSLSLHLD